MTDYGTFCKLNNELLDSQRPDVAKIITDAVISINHKRSFLCPAKEEIKVNTFINHPLQIPVVAER